MITSRGRAIFAAVLALFFILIIPGLVLKRSSEKDLDSLRSKYKELAALNGEYRALKEQVDAIEKKAVLKQPGGIANAIDGITLSAGIKEKIKSVRGIGNRELKGQLNEESADVRLEKVSLNELVNIFYKIGDAPMLLTVRKAQMKKSFENPELFDVTMSVSLFTRK